ncbi:unnamed protein product [Protopolystoma xenopodis]|uniref:Uncharacterized protein n=1 Tax=Protopolystoma xenopodis TaxID=117903 RepID=A0A3S5AF56_9PLAT|nr:unnamed protein product [Protopolystoma xenopodis]
MPSLTSPSSSCRCARAPPVGSPNQPTNPPAQNPPGLTNAPASGASFCLFSTGPPVTSHPISTLRGGLTSSMPAPEANSAGVSSRAARHVGTLPTEDEDEENVYTSEFVLV